MRSIRRITLVLICLAFCLGLFIATSYAQPGRARWEGNRGQHRGWSIGRHRGWDNRGRRIGWDDDYRYGRLSWRERRRLERQRNRLYLARKRYYSDGYYSRGERRRLSERAYRYRRNRNRDWRDW